MNLSLKNKTALICGSTQGIGLAIAIELSQLGTHCILMARNEISLKNALLQLDVLQNQHHNFIVANFSNPDEVKDYSYHSLNEIEASISQTPEKYTAWFCIAFPKVKEWLASQKVEV